jgi:2-methylcitrate dehydratase PrpD
MEFSQTGGMVKRLHAGRAAEGGVMAGYLAAGGFTGPTTVLEGQFGYCAAFSDAPEPLRLLDKLGSSFAIEEITVKPYLCCSDLHAIIDSVYAINKQAKFDHASIEKIRVSTYSKVIEQNSLEPESVMAAQYSALFAAGAAVLSDMSDPMTFLNAPRPSPELKSLCGKVSLEFDKQLNDDYPRTLGAGVTIELNDGRRLSARTVGAKGSPFNPMSANEVEAKFRKMAAPVYDKATIDSIVESVYDLDDAKSVAPLAALLRTSSKVGPAAHA